MSKTRLNFWLDVVIGLAFLVSAATGIAFLFLGSGGYQGGRNAAFQTIFLGLDRAVWSDLHTLGSLVMIAGVGIHLVLHLNWISCVAKRMLPKRLPSLSFQRRQDEQPCELTA